MARRNSQQSVSLFPFLAVLVCTMGALILLLLVTTRRIRQEQARYTAAVEVLDDLNSGDLAKIDSVGTEDFVVEPIDSKAASSVEFQAELFPQTDESAKQHDDLKKQIELAKTRQQELAGQKRSLEIELANQQMQLAALSEQIQETEVELLTTGREIRQLDDANAALQTLKSEKDDLEIQISQQQQMLASVKAELEEKSAFTDEAESVLTKRESALVSLRRLVAKSSENLAADSSATQLEFTNTAGTARVPIVINVDEKGFTFQPSGITVTANDLKGFPRNDNPLIAGIQAAAAHRSEGLLPDDAYVLLLVRPSGSLGFYQAQQVMTNANIHFGYELMEQDRTVEMGPLDAEEVKVVRQSILEALNRRSELYGALLAAQQARSKREDLDGFAQHQARAGATNQSARNSENGDLRGRDGRTLQEIMDLGRMYAAGVPKPDPKVPDYRERVGRPNSWPERSEQIAKADPAFQPPDGQTPFSTQPEQNSTVAAAKPPAEADSEWSAESTQSEEASTTFAQTDGAGTGEKDLLADFRPNRSARLSENIGLNRQLPATEMPNAFVAGQASRGQSITGDFVQDQISPDVDWPSVEAAPQQEGTRPVDSELLSAFGKMQTEGRQAANFDEFTDESELTSQPPSIFKSPSFAALPQQSQSLDSKASGETVQSRQRSDLAPQSDSENQHLANTAGVQQGPRPNADTPVPFIQSQAGNSAFGTPGGGDSGAGQTSEMDPKLSYLQQFLDEVEQERSKQVPNAALLRLLRRAQNDTQGRMSDNLASPGINQPNQRTSQPPTGKSVSQSASVPDLPKAAAVPKQTLHEISEQRNTPSPSVEPKREPPSRDAQPSAKKPAAKAVYYVVRVYMSDSKLVVGAFEPIEISGWSDQRVADAAFMGVSATMRSVWAEVREDALPAVRFLVASGSESRAEIASQQLQKMDIPTRAIQKEGRDLSLQQFFSDKLPPTTRSSTGRASQQSPSAQSLDQSPKQPANSGDRRMSI